MKNPKTPKAKNTTKIDQNSFLGTTNHTSAPPLPDKVHEAAHSQPNEPKMTIQQDQHPFIQNQTE